MPAAHRAGDQPQLAGDLAGVPADGKDRAGRQPVLPVEKLALNAPTFSLRELTVSAIEAIAARRRGRRRADRLGP
jgi:hypothetical protein